MPSPSDATVLVCSRNRPEMLRDGLASILASTPAETEVLVVDSASDTDETRLVTLEAGARYTRAGKGLSVARNAGITTADRPIVVFTDDDCRPTTGWIESLIAPFADPRVSAVTGRMLDHTTDAHAPYARAERYIEPVSGLDAGHGAVMAFRRDVLLRIGGFDDMMGAGQHLAGAEDLDIFIRLLRAGTHVVHDAHSVVLHANTRVGEAYVELHHGYGLGLGALVGKWLRLDPLFGLRVGWRLTRRTGARIARGTRRHHDTRHDRSLLAGMAQGAWEVRGIPIVGERFAGAGSGAPIPVLRAEGVTR